MNVVVISAWKGVKPSDEEDSDADEAGGGDAGSACGNHLTVEQVEVLNAEGHVKVVYPSRVDLVSESFRVDREAA